MKWIESEWESELVAIIEAKYEIMRRIDATTEQVREAGKIANGVGQVRVRLNQCEPLRKVGICAGAERVTGHLPQSLQQALRAANP